MEVCVRTALAFAAFLIIAAPAASAQPTIGVNGAAPSDPVSVAAGSPLTIAVAGGPGNATDWIGLFPAAAGDGGYLDWRYLNGATAPPASGVTSATLTFTAPVAAGAYELRLFANNTYLRIATSGPVTVIASPAALTVNGVAPPTAAPAEAATMAVVALTGGPANATDWIGMFAVGAGDGQYLSWRYLNGSTSPPVAGLSSATLDFLLPGDTGSYEFRLFANNTYARLTTST